MVKIKICGLVRAEDIEAVNAYLPDYAGFVFAESRRRVDAQTARRLTGLLDTAVQRVGVFVNEPPDSAAHIADTAQLNILQLHGDETAEYIAALRARTDCEIWQAVRVRGVVEEIPQTGADRYLFDTYVSGYGGSGKTFQHDYLKKINMSSHILAGGLNADNIAEAVHTAAPYAVDISSGAETGGLKDEEKIKTVIELVRSL